MIHRSNFLRSILFYEANGAALFFKLFPLFHGKFVATFIFRMPRMSFYLGKLNFVRSGKIVQTFPQVNVLNFNPLTSVLAFPSVLFQDLIQVDKPLRTYALSLTIRTETLRFNEDNPSTTACNSMRLFVVSLSPPERSSSLPVGKWRKIKAQPPGPGLPLQAPAVYRITSGSSAILSPDR